MADLSSNFCSAHSFFSQNKVVNPILECYKTTSTPWSIIKLSVFYKISNRSGINWVRHIILFLFFRCSCIISYLISIFSTFSFQENYTNTNIFRIALCSNIIIYFLLRCKESSFISVRGKNSCKLVCESILR
jgi:hypothetical protein